MSTPVSSRPGWWGPVAVAVAVAVIAGLAWWGLRPGQGEPTATGTPTVTTTVTPSPSAPSASGTPVAPGSSTTAPVPGAQQALPVFFVGPQTGQPDAKRWGLVREYVRTTVPAGADASALATAAVGLALAGVPDPNPNGYAGAWPSGTTAVVRVGPSDIAVTISGPGVTGLSDSRKRLAVQQLVWTATAAAQKAVPVAISVTGGGLIFDGVPAGTFSRHPSETAYEVLAPIWVDAPASGETVAAGAVTAGGLACVFEGTLQWQVLAGSGGAVVKEGHTQAASGCPTQGAWKADLGTLPAGAYTLRVFATSAEDGSLSAQHLVPFRAA